jgi:NitT/TauT family transport system substrate-binding protein
MKRLFLAMAALSVAAFMQPAFAAEKITFMIDWLPAGDKAAVYYGVQKGMFAAEGLDVTIQSGRG